MLGKSPGSSELMVYSTTVGVFLGKYMASLSASLKEVVNIVNYKGMHHVYINIFISLLTIITEKLRWHGSGQQLNVCSPMALYLPTYLPTFVGTSQSWKVKLVKLASFGSGNSTAGEGGEKPPIQNGWFSSPIFGLKMKIFKLPPPNSSKSWFGTCMSGIKVFQSRIMRAFLLYSIPNSIIHLQQYRNFIGQVGQNSLDMKKNWGCGVSQWDFKPAWWTVLIFISFHVPKWCGHFSTR